MKSLCVWSVTHGRPVDTTAKEGVVLAWGDFWVLQKRQGILLVRETYEYHSRGEEYGVISERPVGTTAD